jgi:hypothetical protein
MGVFRFFLRAFHCMVVIEKPKDLCKIPRVILSAANDLAFPTCTDEILPPQSSLRMTGTKTFAEASKFLG